MSRLPLVRELTAESAGTGFFLCTRKEVRPGRKGDFIALLLQDRSGHVAAKIFDNVERARGEFEVGDFVTVKAKGNLYNEQLELIVENIRRVNPDQDRAFGFREENCILSAPRPVEEMWAELEALLGGISHPFIKALVERVAHTYEAQLRMWPAAQIIHHAYRGGFLEHILTMARVGLSLAREYGAEADLVVAGALLHDIGKLKELDYDTATSYSRDGRLVGHITLGVLMVRDAAGEIAGFPSDLLTEIEHLILSHHGSTDLGSPVEPMTVEAFILAMVDNLDATINQVRQAIQDDPGDAEFTTYHRRLGRVLWKGRR
jgi:3'-5' exoribonuclease